MTIVDFLNSYISPQKILSLLGKASEKRIFLGEISPFSIGTHFAIPFNQFSIWVHEEYIILQPGLKPLC
jgi:hypothetical protein